VWARLDELENEVFLLGVRLSSFLRHELKEFLPATDDENALHNAAMQMVSGAPREFISEEFLSRLHDEFYPRSDRVHQLRDTVGREIGRNRFWLGPELTTYCYAYYDAATRALNALGPDRISHSDYTEATRSLAREDVLSVVERLGR
jgi:hypothetical protein